MAEGFNRAISILKDKYGKESEITKAYTWDMLDLPTVTNTNPKKISEFSETLNYCVQALQTLNKLEQVNGAVSMTLDKLPGIRGVLVRTGQDWERWDFAQLSEAIRLWVRRNLVDTKTVEREIKQNRRIGSGKAQTRSFDWVKNLTQSNAADTSQSNRL